VTEWPTDKILILVSRAEGELKEIATIASGYANKLVTLISPKLKLAAQTHPHPKNPTVEIPVKGEPTKKGPSSEKPRSEEFATSVAQSWWTQAIGFLGVKLSESETAERKPVAKVTNDCAAEPDIIARAKTTYTGAQITEENWLSAAGDLIVKSK
jgi:hypothetical protein